MAQTMAGRKATPRAVDDPGLTKSTIVALLDRLNAEADAEMANLRSISATGVACRNGCAACCTYVVDASSAEALRIAYWINGRPTKERERLTARMAQWLRDWIVFKAEHGQDYVSSTPVHVAAQWNLRRVACPFLNLNDHSCSIYAVRPVACRMHHACYKPTPDEVEDLIATGQTPPESRQQFATYDPGEGCFQNEADAARGFCPTIWQVDRDALVKMSARYMVEEAKAGIEFEYGNLVPGVLLMGKQFCRWTITGTRALAEAVPTLASCIPAHTDTLGARP